MLLYRANYSIYGLDSAQVESQEIYKSSSVHLYDVAHDIQSRLDHKRGLR